MLWGRENGSALIDHPSRYVAKFRHVMFARCRLENIDAAALARSTWIGAVVDGGILLALLFRGPLR